MSQILYVRERMIIKNNNEKLNELNKKIKEYLECIALDTDKCLEFINDFEIVINNERFDMTQKEIQQNVEIWEKFNTYSSFEFYLDYATYGMKGKFYFENILKEDYKKLVKYMVCQYMEMDENTSLYYYLDSVNNNISSNDFFDNNIKKLTIHYGCINIEKDENVSKKSYSELLKIIKQIIKELDLDKDDFEIEKYEEDEYQEINVDGFEQTISVDKIKYLEEKYKEIFNLVENTNGLDIVQLCLPCIVEDKYKFGKYDIFYDDNIKNEICIIGE